VKLSLTINETKGHLRQLLETREDLTAEQRYSVMAAIETMGFMQKLSPGLRKVVDEQRRKNPQATMTL